MERIDDALLGEMICEGLLGLWDARCLFLLGCEIGAIGAEVWLHEGA